MIEQYNRLIEKYLPALDQRSKSQLLALPDLYKMWNEKINVVSRKDIDNIFTHHILHSLSIGLFTNFTSDSSVFDIGTGGGLPGIPLAILFPEVQFTLIDSIGKKLKVAESIADAINLNNVSFYHGRAEDLKGRKRCHFVVSRGAMQMDLLVRVAKPLVLKEQVNALPNGVIALKGGDLKEELRNFKKIVMTEEVSKYYPDEEYFETKKIVYIPL